jgi:hypothetical protein
MHLERTTFKLVLKHKGMDPIKDEVTLVLEKAHYNLVQNILFCRFLENNIYKITIFFSLWSCGLFNFAVL